MSEHRAETVVSRLPELAEQVARDIDAIVNQKPFADIDSLAVERIILKALQQAQADALSAAQRLDNGNAFVFCDYVDEKLRGCVRGAGHNGPHAVCLPPYPLGPVVLLADRNTP